MKLSFDDLASRYEQLTTSIRCDCVLATEMVGGLPADRIGLEAFIKHYLKITDPKEATEALARISHDEAIDIRPPEGELEEKLTYGVRIVRKTPEIGPWLGNWMIKACMKQAASRLGVFQDTRGSKGSYAESGRVYAIGDSLKEPDHPERIYLSLSEPTYFQEFMGRVNSPSGAVSIIHHSECIPPGSRFSFEYRLLPGLLKNEDIRDVLAMAMIMGVGSARSLERGKFRIESAEITEPSEKRVRSKTKDVPVVFPKKQVLKDISPVMDSGEEATA
jgi:hypothetical protein